MLNPESNTRGFVIPATKYAWSAEADPTDLSIGTTTYGTSSPGPTLTPYQLDVFFQFDDIEQGEINREVGLTLPEVRPFRIHEFDKYSGDETEVDSGWLNIRLENVTFTESKLQFSIQSTPASSGQSLLSVLPDGRYNVYESLINTTSVLTGNVNVGLVGLVSNGDGTYYHKFLSNLGLGATVENNVMTKLSLSALFEAYLKNRNLFGFYLIVLPPSSANLDLESASSFEESFSAMYAAFAEENLTYELQSSGPPPHWSVEGTVYDIRQWRWETQFISMQGTGLTGVGLQTSETLQNLSIPV